MSNVVGCARGGTVRAIAPGRRLRDLGSSRLFNAPALARLDAAPRAARPWPAMVQTSGARRVPWVLHVLLAASATASVACADSHYSFKLEHAGKPLTACDDAEIGDLSPAGGGFKLTCVGSERASIYLINATGAGSDGTLKEIVVNPSRSDVTYLPAYRATAGGELDCPSALALGRKTGEPPVPARTHGSWTLAMARPCGEVVLTIGPAKQP